MASKKPAPARTAKAAAAKENGTPTVPKRIYAQASPHSQGGTSMFESQELITSSTAANFLSDPDLVNRAVLRLQDAGFEVLQVSALTINIAGSPETYKKAFETTIVADERSVLKELGERSTATFLDSSDTGLSGLINTVGTRFEDVLEGVAIEEPRYFMSPSMFAPLKSYWHLRVPGDISLGCNADRAHRGGITGRGIKIAMVDSGHYSHPFFAGRGYRVSPVVLGPAAANPTKDESGHGTGESANIFAVAPDIQLMPVKINFVNSIGAFNAAVALAPDIITCSWGSSNQNGPLSAADQALAAAISVAVASGITVVFSAGNGHYGFPGQHPDVISAGGVFMNPDESLRASDYASGFMSNIYPGRRVPDLSGLVGMKPKAMYIMLPIEAGDDIDVQLSGGTHPNGDETTNSDGWGAFSGTSAAAPQLAGAAALVKQACPHLKPAEICNILKKSARDVTTGNCNTSSGGNPATVGPDTATGNGLVDAHKAVLLAKVKCLGPIQPIVPIQPIQPIQPVQPIQPIVPVLPIQPVQPIVPPIKPPIQPIRPIAPIVLPSPIENPQDSSSQSFNRGLSEDDIAALEELIVKDNLKL
jgi:subtilisin family serine protease